MQDVIFILVTVALFVVASRYSDWCDKV